MVGKVGRVIGTVMPGRLGEVMVPVRGGTEAFNAYAADRCHPRPLPARLPIAVAGGRAERGARHLRLPQAGKDPAHQGLGFKIVTGKGVAVVPGFQQVRRLTLDLRG